MYIGAAYYPELWDEAEIDRDIAVCKEFGLNTLRIAEFAWSRMEPKEGKFDFDWLQRVMDKLHAADIKVLLCTPTCTPPRWLLTKYPETKTVMDTGERVEVSSRCHPCKSSPKMREKNCIIVTEMAKRFGHHPALIGWQIDNELYVYDNGCHCPLCRKNFRKWLKDRYGTIENLNRAFVMDRWSLTYDSFEDVIPPKRSEWAHPSLEAAWFEFYSNLTVDYAEEQAEILHKYSDAPVGTDLMVLNRFSFYNATKKLDVVQLNHYDTARRLTRPPFFYNFMRPMKDRPFWVTETQVGWNGSKTAQSRYRPEGNCYVNTWLPFAMGGEMNLYWLFRAHTAGHEIAHGAILSASGRPYRVSEEVKQAAQDIRKALPFLEDSAVKSKIALHYSSAGENDFAVAPIVENMPYFDTILQKFHDAFWHYNVDVIEPCHSLEGYEVLISPLVPYIPKEDAERIKEWVENGGTWIVGPLTDIYDASLKKNEKAPFYFLEDFAGVYTVYQKPIINEVFRAKWQDGSPAEISTYFDAFRPTDAKALVTYDGEEFDGYAVVTERKVGKGKVILLGSVLGIDDLRKLVDLPPIAEASENIRLIERSGKENGIIVAELKHEPGFVALDGTYTDLLTGRTLSGRIDVKEHEVLVLKKV